MFAGILNTLGGLGVFLLGMHIMSRGLYKLAGEKLRKFLANFTKNNISGIMTGAVATATIQSSSATTITAVGFVNAGLMRFTQALAIIVGANLGTTVTGWLVAGLGFKLKLLLVVQPLIFIGAFLILFFNQRIANIGKALAGFGLVFVGISLLQNGMSGLTEMVNPESFPGDHFRGRVYLVFIGIFITIITQSSSAGVAMAVTALNTGTISLHQAAAMVIGMDIGTTFTAYLATLGASTQAKRTGYAHVIYNIITGIMAFLLLVPFFQGYGYFAADFLNQEAELALVSFHTSFNALGILMILPFMNGFANFLKKVVPETKSDLTSTLDSSLKDEPELAVPALKNALIKITKQNISLFKKINEPDRIEKSLDALRQALIDCQDFVMKIRSEDSKFAHNKLAAVHIIDHMDRMINRLGERHTLELISSENLFKPILEKMISELHACTQLLDEKKFEELQKTLNSFWKSLVDSNTEFRQHTFQLCMSKKITSEEAMNLQDAMRWLKKNGYHLWRCSYYLTERDSGQKT